MKKFILAAFLAVSPVLAFAAPVFADSPGQLSSAPTDYEVKNVTQNGAYGQSASAACNETVKYSVLLANSEFGLLRNLTVKANLASGAISASAVNAANDTTSVSGSVNVSHPGTLQYVNGSTVRITSDGQTRTPQGDGVVTAAGENVGELTGSTQTFVQFEAKVHCETPPPVQIQVCELATKKIITINEGDFDSAKHTRDMTKCNATPVAPTTPQVLASTGPVETFAQIVGVTALAGAISYYIASRRQNTLG